MKRPYFFPIVSALLLLLSSPAGDIQAQDFTYVVADGQVAITGYSGPGGEVFIPSTIDELPVVVIGVQAFADRSGILTVTLPDTVTTIEAAAFSSCTSLEQIVGGNGLTRIGFTAFYGCTSLTHVAIHNKVIAIEDNAFEGCTSLVAFDVDPLNAAYSSTEGVLLNKDQTSLIRYPGGRPGSYTIPEGVITILPFAFSSSTSLTRLVIPASVTAIGDSAFYASPRLEAIEVNPQNLAYSSQEGVLYDRGQTILIRCPGGKEGSITIPNSVTSFGRNAFNGCNSLASVTLGTSLTRIEGYLFYGCTKLARIIIPNSVTVIEERAFLGCAGLTNIVLPDSLTSIGYEAFHNCASLEEIDLGNGLTSIDGGAFSGCTGLGSVKIPNSVVSLGHSLFAGCSSLVRVTLSDRVTAINDYTFDGCASLASVSIPEGVTTIRDSAFFFCSSLTSVAIPGTVTSIGTSAFSQCASLTRVTIPGSVGVIGDSAFQDNISLTQIRLEEGVKRIGKSTFSGCSRLTSVALPNSLAQIGASGFSGCSSLTSIAIPTSMSGIEDLTFAGCAGLISVSIPSTVTTIGYAAFADCNSLSHLALADGVATIGNAAFANCSSLIELTFPKSVTSLGYSAFSGCRGLTTLRIPKSITDIRGGTFVGCSSLTAIEVDDLNPTYSSVGGVLFDKSQSFLIQYPPGKAGQYSIPLGVTGIDGFAFSGCPQLTGIEIVAANSPYLTVDGVLYDKDQTVLINYPAGKAGAYTIPKTVAGISGAAFQGCSGLTRLGITDGLSSIQNSLFSGCTGLIAFEVDSLSSRYSAVDGVLYNKNQTLLIACPKAKAGSFLIPDGVLTIQENALRGCPNLTQITVPDSATSIGRSAFAGCTSLARVTIGKGVREIDPQAFSFCTSLESASFEGDQPNIDSQFDLFEQSDSMIVYYRDGTQGWSNRYPVTWALHPPVLQTPSPLYGEWVKTTALLSQYPQASAENDDADQDGMSNYDEMLAGTVPTASDSRIILERVPRPNDLTEADQTKILVTQHALYLRSVPGKSYGVQIADTLGGPWRTTTVMTASTSQTRLVLDRPRASWGTAFYRVILAQGYLQDPK